MLPQLLSWWFGLVMALSLSLGATEGPLEAQAEPNQPGVRLDHLWGPDQKQTNTNTRGGHLEGKTIDMENTETDPQAGSFERSLSKAK